MSSEKRQRQRENRMRAVAQAERAQKRSSTTRKVVRIVLIVAVVLLALWLWSIFTGNDADSDSDSDADSGTQVANDGEVTTPASASDSELETGDNPDGANSDSAGTPVAAGCPALDGSDGPRTQFDSKQPMCIDAETMYAARFETNMGEFTMVLDPALDLDSVNNFVVLGRWGAFDGTLFHRVISNFVIQGGDVQMLSGMGTPGYRYTGAFPPEDWYRLGSVAMANSGNPATNGSQFFIITGDDGVALPALYSPLGHVVDGMNVVMDIDGVATAPGDAPIEEVVVESVTITEATQTQITAYEDARS